MFLIFMLTQHAQDALLMMKSDLYPYWKQEKFGISQAAFSGYQEYQAALSTFQLHSLQDYVVIFIAHLVSFGGYITLYSLSCGFFLSARSRASSKTSRHKISDDKREAVSGCSRTFISTGNLLIQIRLQRLEVPDLIVIKRKCWKTIQSDLMQILGASVIGKPSRKLTSASRLDFIALTIYNQ